MKELTKQKGGLAPKKRPIIPATAYHEAGHAFADWYHGFKVKSASIVPDEKTAGRVRTSCRLRLRKLEFTKPGPAELTRLHLRVVSFCAGMLRSVGSIPAAFALATRRWAAHTLWIC
jgi:hypothetical protein